MRIVVAVDEAVGSAVERANRRIADAAEGRTTPAAVEAALERAREAIDSGAARTRLDELVEFTRS